MKTPARVLKDVSAKEANNTKQKNETRRGKFLFAFCVRVLHVMYHTLDCLEYFLAWHTFVSSAMKASYSGVSLHSQINL